MGQAKRNQVKTASASGAQSIDKYMEWIVDAYFVYMMTIFILVCPQGYVQYDYYKRNLLYIGTVPFVVISLVFILISMANAEDIKEYFKGKFGKTDLFMLMTLVCWTISYLGCADKQSGFWGDVYRYIGFSSMALTMIACWIISRYYRFAKWQLWLFLAVSCVVFIWQVLNQYGIDPLNWQMDRQYTWLVSVFANTNQNAVFDAVALAVAVYALLIAENRIKQIACGVVIFLGMAGGIATQSETFFVGTIIVVFVLVGYALAHVEYLWKTWCVGVLLLIAIIVQKFGCQKQPVWLESRMVILLFQPKILMLLGGGLVVLGTVILVGKRELEKYSRLVVRMYLGLFVLVVLGVIGLFIYVNKTEIDPMSESVLLQLKFNDYFGSARGVIWRVTVSLFKDANLFQKIFGIGMDNYSSFVYLREENAADLNMFFQGSVLADAHNIYLDILISSGILGLIGFFGVIVGVLNKNLKSFKISLMAVCSVMCVGAYLMAGMLNGNLIVTTPIFFILLGCFWKNSRELKRLATK